MHRPPVDLITMLARQVEARGDAPCITHKNQQVSFRTLDQRAAGVARALRGSGLQPGDRVALLVQACPAVFEMLFGCAKAGVILLPLNWRLSPHEIAQIIVDADPALLIVESSLSALLAESEPRQTLGLEEDYDRWRDGSRPSPLPAVDPDATTLILYTSGTTGLPKGVMLSQRNLAHMERLGRELWSFDADSVNLVAMPLFHIGGVGYGLLAVACGGETIIERRTDPAALIETITRHRVTHAFFVPTLIQRLVDYLASSGTVAPKVAHMVYGAAPIGEVLLRRALSTFGCAFHHAYGLTESGGTIVTLDPADHDLDGAHKARLRSCGRPTPWVELVLVDPVTGARAAGDEIGEIRVRSPAVTKGYWRNATETARAITPDGWFCTGDAATLDEDGFLFIQDRYKDMIVSGGENIYPAEIDNVLQHHPAVSEVAVIGVPHDTWGETPRAFVVLRPGASATQEELLSFARGRLARYKCPTSVVFMDALPRSGSGKILKRELRS